MTESKAKTQHQAIYAGAKAAIAQALERHRKLRESIAIWCDGKVVILPADQIPSPQTSHPESNSSAQQES
ncbi:hypothetical protein C7B76_11350 [filamentous cyanobacterium CCP2]|nr:hypothetical protein C7B76_11350 [filamentous cyanobacterium CCP2]